MDPIKYGAVQEARIEKDTPFWRDERVISIAAQIISAVIIVGVIYWIFSNIVNAAERRGLGLGFRFLDDAAGFSISESIIPYSPSDSFLRALLVGTLNTLRVSLMGIILATILGFIVGIAQLSSNWLVSRIALTFVELHRNIPLLVLLFLWYRGIFTQLPSVRESLQLPGPIFINQRGIYITWPTLTDTGWVFLIFALLGLVAAVMAWMILKRIRVESGRTTNFGGVSLGVLVIGLFLGWLLSGRSPFTFDFPELQGFNFRGGLHLTPEFAALLIGLTTYTAAFIAEVVRGGIQAVQRGQLEAAAALGLRGSHILNLVVIPQAMRIIIPPLISQYLNLIKNSSLAVFLGFPELFSIGKTVINQAGRAIPVFVLIMAVYLVISLVTSLLLNIYNRRVQFVER